MRNIFRLALSFLLPLVVGGASAYFTFNGLEDWYPTLVKPSFNPPNYVFGPVWTVLYLLMGYSFYQVLKAEPSMERTRAILIFALQLLLNFWWSIFFFAFKRPEVAMVEILSLWFSILWMIAAFRSVSPRAAYIQIPYALWVAFATLLNISIWMLN